MKIFTAKDPEGLEVIRHDTAHIMAMAVQELYPGTQVTIGPVIENGFYYDFARKEPFTEDDLKKIEKKMTEIIAQNPAFIAVYPYIRRAINTTKESSMCHPLFNTSITFGSIDLSIFSIPCFSASTWTMK